MAQQPSIQAQLSQFFKEVDSNSAEIVNIDGLVDSVLRHWSVLEQIPGLSRESSGFDSSTLNKVFSEIVKQIYSSISCYDFNGKLHL